jgi:hypothetical protein
MLDFDGLNRLIGTPELLAVAARYDEQANGRATEKGT